MKKTVLLVLALLSVFLITGCDIVEDLFGVLGETPDIQVSSIEVTREPGTNLLIGVEFNIYVDGEDSVDAVELELVVNQTTSFSTALRAYTDLANLNPEDNTFYVSLSDIEATITANDDSVAGADGPYYAGVRIQLTEGDDANNANNEDFSVTSFELPDINL